LHVVQLSLPAYGLVGTIPGSLAQLTELLVLDLESNGLYGTVPDTLAQLVRLTELDLFHNALSGTIPSTLGQLFDLRILHISANKFSGPIPDSLGQLTNLREMYLDANFLTSTLPESSLGLLTALVTLDIDTNFITGTIPDSLGQLTQLIALYLNVNQLTGLIPDYLAKLTGLRVLALDTNQLSGKVPHFLGKLEHLAILYLASNQLTGSIFQNWTLIESTLVLLHMQENHLTGSIPESLGRVPLMLNLNLSSNHLSGNIPASFQYLSSLKVLMLQHNRLKGNITGLFNLVQQTNLTTIQLSSNQLSGTLPDKLFLLPSLTSFAAVDNCFDGPLPTKTICDSTSMSALVLDGMHSASACKNSASLSRKAFQLGSLPPCLLFMRNLVTLHLSGSGLSGSLPSHADVSAVLTDLSLSHNLLTGSIPESILDRNWEKLDLSYNRFAGTLNSARAAPYGNATELHLQHNRLSGVIPGGMQNVGRLSLLVSNMFSCKADGSDVPEQDSDSHKYTCGSDAVNNALFAWLGAVTVALLFGLLSDLGLAYRRTLTNADLDIGSVCESKVPRLIHVFRAARALTVLGVGCAAYSVVVLLPAYAAVNSYRASFTYKYAWTVSGVFLTGTAAFGVEATLLLLQLPLCSYVSARLLSRVCPGLQGQRTESAPSAANILRCDAQESIADAAVMLFSLAVVTGINVGFVLATLSFNGRTLTVIQILLAVFKLGFNNVVAPTLRNRVRVQGTKGNRVPASELFLVLLNVLVIPCLVVMVISPACFYDALKGTDSVTSNYNYGEDCKLFVFSIVDMSISCDKYQTALSSTVYTPPFTYSYQCSSSFVTSYAPTFVIMCIISGFVIPVYHSLLLWSLRNLSPASRLHAIVLTVTPRVLMELPSVQSLTSDRSNVMYQPVFSANQLVMSLMTYLSLLLTFGALFPLLAVCCAFAMTSMLWTAQLEVGLYVRKAVAADRLDCLDELESACTGVAAPQRLLMAVTLMLTLCCMFYTLFLFDTFGDEVGFAGAFWVLVVVPLLPVVVLSLPTAAKTLLGGPPVAPVPAHKLTSEAGVEFTDITDITPCADGCKLEAVDLSSANPMHA
jgi:Leucine-rich repeat (LRR) protein